MATQEAAASAKHWRRRERGVTEPAIAVAREQRDAIGLEHVDVLPAARADGCRLLFLLQADLHVTQTVDGNKGIHCMIDKKLIGG